MATTPPPAPPRTISHVTVPCRDLALAEAFYVRVLGLRVVGRVDAARRVAMGWSDDDVRARAADHVAVAAADGVMRLDLFEYPQGAPPPDAPKHPHIGLDVAAEHLPHWKDRLQRCGVPVDGPRRLGPPGQASLYFDDPSGNHLEIHADGVDTSDLPLGGPQRPLSYHWDGVEGR